MARKSKQQRMKDAQRQKEYRRQNPVKYERWKRLSYIRYLEKHGYTVLPPDGVDRDIWDRIAGM